MNNPWTVLANQLRDGTISTSCIALDVDKPAIEKFNKKIDSKENEDKEKQIVHLEQLPEPFIGNPEAKVVVLNLNPRYDEEETKNYQDTNEEQADNYKKIKLLRELTISNWEHGLNDADYPFYPLNPKFDASIGIAKYWSGAFKSLLQEVGKAGYSAEEARKKVAQNIFVVECFPYHSQNGGGHPVVPSQKYSVQLVQEAIERGSMVVVIRHKHHWEHAIIDLVEHKNRYNYKNAQSASLSCKNIVHNINKSDECGFNEIVKTICGKYSPAICNWDKKD